MPDTNAEIIVLGNRTLGTIEGPLFGQFLELGGRCVNDGIYDPKSPLAREDGVRPDVVEAIRELKPTHIRYPGGCGVSYFDWQELVGPVEDRPRAKLFRLTGVPQSTAFGIPECYALCEELGCELYLVVNANTQSPEDAAHLVEYLNSTAPTRYADLRREHGREEPYNVRLFSLGNEIYGDWQAGQRHAENYTLWCREAITQMKRVDPSIKVIINGVGRPNPEYDRTVLFGTIGLADMISAHNYFGRPVFKDSMAASRVCEEFLNAVNVAIDEAMDTQLGVNPRTWRELGGAPQVAERPGISFDEWNVWYRGVHTAECDNEEIYDYTDALTVASLMHVILRNTKTIKLANHSLAVNMLGSIMTDRERCIRQTIWYPQRMLRDRHSGRVVEVAVDCPTFSAKHERFFCGIVDPEKAQDDTLPSLLRFDDLDALDAVVSVDDERGRTTMSVLQKLEDQQLTVQLTWRGVVPKGETMTVTRLTGGESLSATNTLDSPDNVGIESGEEPLTDTLELPPASLTVFEFNT
jgi:alpha-N-arabinofuranosidase